MSEDDRLFVRAPSWDDTVSEDDRFFAWMAIQLSRRPEFAGLTKEQLADATCEWLDYLRSRAYEHRTGLTPPTIINIVGSPSLPLEEGAKLIFGESVAAKQAVRQLENYLPPEQMRILRGVGRISRAFCEESRQLIQETRARELSEKKRLAGKASQAAQRRAKKTAKRKR